MRFHFCLWAIDLFVKTIALLCQLHTCCILLSNEETFLCYRNCFLGNNYKPINLREVQVVHLHNLCFIGGKLFLQQQMQCKKMKGGMEDELVSYDVS